MCGDDVGKVSVGLVSQLPSLTPFSQQDGPGDVGAADLGARGSDGLHHSPAAWQLGAAALLPQRHDVPHRRPPQHGLVRTAASEPSAARASPRAGDLATGKVLGPWRPWRRAAGQDGLHARA